MIQVTHPLCDRNMISARLDAVSEISESMGSSRASQNIGGLDGEDSDITIVQPEFSYILSSVLTNLGRSPDIQRGITRIFHRTAAPSEVINHYPLDRYCVLIHTHTHTIYMLSSWSTLLKFMHPHPNPKSIESCYFYFMSYMPLSSSPFLKREEKFSVAQLHGHMLL